MLLSITRTNDKRSSSIFKKAVISGITAAMIPASGALAADDFIPAAPASMDWSGAYAGVTGGYGWGTEDVSGTRTGPLAPTFRLSGELEPEGYIGGFLVGYDHQIDALVYGVAADFSFADIDDHGSLQGITGKTDIDWISTIRGRIGYAHDNLLFYGTGGLAIADITNSTVDDGSGFTPPVISYTESSETRTGWVLGGGVEWALTDNLSFGGEYLAMNFGDKSFSAACSVSCAGGTTSSILFEHDDTHLEIARATLTWWFGQ